MASTALVKGYSQAVFQMATERGEVDRWQSDLNRIASLARENAFIALLENPKFPPDARTRLLSEVLADINPLALNMVYLLVARGSFGAAGEIYSEYLRLLDKERNIERAEVTTAIPLTEEDKARLEEKLGNMVNKKVIIKSKVDSGLLGGIVVRMGGKLLDGSTKSRLEALKRELSGTAKNVTW